MSKSDRGYKLLFILPTFILFTTFIIFPVVLGIYYSMTKWDALGTPLFVGIKNYKKLIGDADYFVALKNTSILSLIGLVVQIPIALMIAYMIFKIKIGARFFRVAVFLPVVISNTAIGVMFTVFLSGDFGPINSFFGSIGLESLQLAWLADSRIVLYSVIFPMIWQFIGFYVVIYLAALYSISPAIFESAVIDGAGSFKIFYRIVVPLLRDIIGITAVLSVTGSLKAFEHSYIMTWGGPGVLSSFLGVYVYRHAFYNANFGYGSAIGVTVLLFALVVYFFYRKFALQQADV
jgi:raffinose/stachyose/melibiose transport system permease protein